MDEDHTRSAWLPHSYENIFFIQEHYESVVMSSQMGDQTLSISTLMHKGHFVYESAVGSRTWPLRINDEGHLYAVTQATFRPKSSRSHYEAKPLRLSGFARQAVRAHQASQGRLRQ
jgi:hypothetical protein